MTQIKFSDNELTELQTFYKHELDKTLKRIEDIKAILKKLNSPQTNTPTRTVKLSKSLPADTSSDIKRKVKRKSKLHRSPVDNRKLGKYPIFILDTLSASDKPMRMLEILPLMLKQFNISNKQDKAKVERNLRGHLLRMTRRSEVKAVKIKGQRDNLYSV